jgi:hypothetical protein
MSWPISHSNILTISGPPTNIVGYPGETWFDPATGTLYISTGSAWKVFTTGNADVQFPLPVELGPSSITIPLSGVQQFYAFAGSAPYTYSVISGDGSIDSSGLYTAPSSETVAIIQVVDSQETPTIATATVNVQNIHTTQSIQFPISTPPTDGKSILFSSVSQSITEDKWQLPFDLGGTHTSPTPVGGYTMLGALTTANTDTALDFNAFIFAQTNGEVNGDRVFDGPTSFSTAQIFDSSHGATCRKVTGAWLDATHYLAVEADDNQQYLVFTIGVWSGTIAWGANTTATGAWRTGGNYAYRICVKPLDSSHVLIGFWDYTNKLAVGVITWSGNAVTSFGTILNSFGDPYTNGVFDIGIIDSTHFFVAFPYDGGVGSRQVEATTFSTNYTTCVLMHQSYWTANGPDSTAGIELLQLNANTWMVSYYDGLLGGSNNKPVQQILTVTNYTVTFYAPSAISSTAYISQTHIYLGSDSNWFSLLQTAAGSAMEYVYCTRTGNYITFGPASSAIGITPSFQTYDRYEPIAAYISETRSFLVWLDNATQHGMGAAIRTNNGSLQLETPIQITPGAIDHISVAALDYQTIVTPYDDDNNNDYGTVKVGNFKLSLKLQNIGSGISLTAPSANDTGLTITTIQIGA